MSTVTRASRCAAGVHPAERRMVLTLNAGSSSLKFAFFHTRNGPVRVLSGAVERIGSRGATLHVAKTLDLKTRSTVCEAPNHAAAFEQILRSIRADLELKEVWAVGHRIVHGGNRYLGPERVSEEMLRELERLRALAPEHLPAELELLTTARAHFPGVEQVACFDTAFHRDLPLVAKALAIPRRYADRGLCRYGFHGLSYEFLLEELNRLKIPAAKKGRVILAHLGNGCSLAALRDGRCVDTSMALTPSAGLMMGTRSGDLDPGLILYLARVEGLTLDEVERVVNHESGLLGVSETSSDVRVLLAREPKDRRSAEALDLFCYVARKWIGAFAAALGGLDLLVFSGGIGENSPAIRQRICRELKFLGITLNPARNAANAMVISRPQSRVETRVIPTDEELMIARSVCRVLDRNTPKPKHT